MVADKQVLDKSSEFSANKLIEYNITANKAKAKEADIRNQKIIAQAEKDAKEANERLGKKNMTDEKRAKEQKTIAEANAKKQEVLLKKGPSDAKIELDATNDLISLMEEEFKETGKTRKDEKKMRVLEKKKFQLELKNLVLKLLFVVKYHQIDPMFRRNFASYKINPTLQF